MELFGALILILAALLIALLFFWRVVFLRDPERIIPPGRSLVAPCDGRVVEVVRFSQKKLKVKKGLFGKIYPWVADVAPQGGTLVSIFMSPLDVHVTRAPAPGKVVSITHRPGRFKPVMSLEAGLVNEHAEFLMEHKSLGKFKFFLIAGFLARRVEPWVKEGQVVKKGERTGVINLGSQVTMVFNKKVDITLKKGDVLVAGTSVIGTY